MDMWICSENIEQLAKECYLHTIFDEAEFWEDFDRIKYIKRLFNRYKETGVIKTNLIVNHLIILFNVFESRQLTRILFYKFEGYHHYLKPFLVLLQRCPDRIEPYTPNCPVLFTSSIADHGSIVEQLRQRLYEDE